MSIGRTSVVLRPSCRTPRAPIRRNVSDARRLNAPLTSAFSYTVSASGSVRMPTASLQSSSQSSRESFDEPVREASIRSATISLTLASTPGNGTRMPAS
eukprot:5409458-Prymnesium_polylepis.1